ncbi:hypothetical protein TNCV_2380531 [Trichonephila clavipes]|nr:hypothetical protein TNCV_2380531 [Trichonephila clavipes]
MSSHPKDIHCDEVRMDRNDGNSANANKSPEDEELISFVHEQLLTINTPSSSYRYSREDYKNGDDENSKVLISYENTENSNVHRATVYNEHLQGHSLPDRSTCKVRGETPRNRIGM